MLYITYIFADMVELVDTLDLGSSDDKSWGFKSLYPHHFNKQIILSKYFKNNDKCCKQFQK